MWPELMCKPQDCKTSSGARQIGAKALSSLKCIWALGQYPLANGPILGEYRELMSLSLARRGVFVFFLATPPATRFLVSEVTSNTKDGSRVWEVICS